ncbi:amidoligase family protein [Rhodosalinus sp. 5P4]|uniref:amidoligase family protein n=1 Tax=Rhodosalinus sp. 5P4 TaxID=3239196 RepID=UPI003523DD43
MTRFAPLPSPENSDGHARRTGVEVEFGGLSEIAAADVIAKHLGGRVVSVGGHDRRVEDSRIGGIDVYLDTALREKLANWPRLLDAGRELAREVVPVEIVTEPLDRDGLLALDDARKALREAGATGSRAGVVFGFGVHLNVEIVSDAAQDVVRPLMAYALVEDWLRLAAPINEARRVLPFTDPYPTSFVRRLVALGPEAGLAPVIDIYLEETPTRNRGLDMLPVFAHLDPDRVAAAITGATSARPAFHFRLPDCRIDESDWSLDLPWRQWRTVERVAADGDLLGTLATRWEAAHGAVTLFRGAWGEEAGAILAARGIETP